MNMTKEERSHWHEQDPGPPLSCKEEKRFSKEHQLNPCWLCIQHIQYGFQSHSASTANKTTGTLAPTSSLLMLVSSVPTVCPSNQSAHLFSPNQVHPPSQRICCIQHCVSLCLCSCSPSPRSPCLSCLTLKLTNIQNWVLFWTKPIQSMLISWHTIEVIVFLTCVCY